MQRSPATTFAAGSPSRAPSRNRARPEEFAAIIDREVTMWSDLVKTVGIKPE